MNKTIQELSRRNCQATILLEMTNSKKKPAALIDHVQNFKPYMKYASYNVNNQIYQDVHSLGKKRSKQREDMKRLPLKKRKIIKKRVQFNTHQNVVNERYYSKDDLAAAWLNDKECDQIKRSVRATIQSYRWIQIASKRDDRIKSESNISNNKYDCNGFTCKYADLYNNICMRGLEQYFNPVETREKVQSMITHRRIIISHSRFLLFDKHYSTSNDAYQEQDLLSDARTSDEKLHDLASWLSSSDVNKALLDAAVDAIEAR